MVKLRKFLFKRERGEGGFDGIISFKDRKCVTAVTGESWTWLKIDEVIEKRGCSGKPKGFR